MLNRIDSWCDDHELLVGFLIYAALTAVILALTVFGGWWIYD